MATEGVITSSELEGVLGGGGTGVGRADGALGADDGGGGGGGGGGAAGAVTAEGGKGGRCETVVDGFLEEMGGGGGLLPLGGGRGGVTRETGTVLEESLLAATGRSGMFGACKEAR